MLIGAYDQVTDESSQKVQNEISTLLVGIEKNIENNKISKSSYDNLNGSFVTIEGDIKSLKVRCSSLPKYKIVLSRVSGLESNVADL